MKIFVLNCGSSSLKFQLIETTPERIAANDDIVHARGSVDKIGSNDALISYQQDGGEKKRETRPVLKHKDAIQAAFDLIGHADIEGIGHRVVHGGEHFHESALIDDDVLKRIEASVDLAPLHNPHNLKGIYASQALFPDAKNVAVFDTSFHQTMPDRAYLYGIPHLFYTRNKLRRYGFHGTSHRFISYRYAKLQGKTRADFKLISCHLGNGCSVCAIEHGESIDTSMGFTPLEGLIMGTRAGDLDPGAVLYLVEQAEMGMHEVDVMLNKHSGLYGISGVSNDMREILAAADSGNERARAAVDVFCYRVKKYIGSYLAAMNGADAILFAGGIGENAASIRAQICSGLDSLGIAIDPAKNDGAIGKDADITAAGSPTQVWVIPTDEELLIARDTLRCILGLPQP